MDDPTTQGFVTIVIFINFITTALSVTSWALNNTDVTDVLDILDNIFVVIYIIELVTNLFAFCSEKGEDVIVSWCICRWEFFTCHHWMWNCFDVIVIVFPLVVGA